VRKTPKGKTSDCGNRWRKRRLVSFIFYNSWFKYYELNLLELFAIEAELQ